MTELVGADIATAETRAVGRRRSYGRYVLSKVLGAFGSLCFVLVVNFFLFRVLPGDPARTLGRDRFKTKEQLDAFRAEYGLDQPLGRQFLTYLHNTATFHLGDSLRYRVPVSHLIEQRLWPTLLVVGTSTALAVVIGVWIGINGAWNRSGKFDRSSTGFTLTLYSMPEWWLGLILIVVLAVGLGPVGGVFPTGGLHSTDVDPNSVKGVFDTAWHLFLPVLTLTLAYLAEYSLIMRSSLLDEIGRAHV